MLYVRLIGDRIKEAWLIRIQVDASQPESEAKY